MNSFVIKQDKIINKIKYYAYKLLFPISFIDIFKSNICSYTNVNLYDAPKIYHYLNEYNNMILTSREHLSKLKEMTKWGLLSDSYILLKIKTEYLIKMINMYSNLILKFIRNNTKTNKIHDISYSNYLNKYNILLFMKICKIGNKYISINENSISSVSALFIDTLFPLDFDKLYNNDINYPLCQCDQID
jgi:hypothetical protein